MKILIPADTLSKNPTNPYQLQLIRSLHSEPLVQQVAYGADLLFWDKCSWDVVHFQWPEAAFGWKKPGRRALARLESELERRQRRSAIVTTVHNLYPSPAFEEMGEPALEVVYSRTDAFVHLGQASLEAFKERYAGKEWLEKADHYVIPHGDYSYYATLEQDRSILNGLDLPRGCPLVLVFGGLRTVEEEALARQTFYAADYKNARLLFAGSPTRSAIPKEILRGKLDRPDGRIIRMHKRIADEQVPVLFKAASVVFVPRVGRLNSGVVPLAFTFGVPVVAPDEGVLGEMVREAGGFLYSPADLADAARQLRRALSMTREERETLAVRMEDYRRRKLSWRAISREHLRVYGECLAAKRGLDEASLAARKLHRAFRVRSGLMPSGARPDTRRVNGETRTNSVCFTIALNGYGEHFRDCIRTHERYCLRYGYTYWRITDVPWAMSAKQCAWLKVEVMRGLLSAGAAHVGFLDADCELRPHTPPFENEYKDETKLLIACGKSGRVNSGLLFARPGEDLCDFLELLIEKADFEVPKEDATTYENGHFIHYGRGVDFIGILEHKKWNNNSVLDYNSYVQHYSRGNLRRWWDANKAVTRPKAECAGNKVDVTGLSVREFLAAAREHLKHRYAEVATTRRRIVVN